MRGEPSCDLSERLHTSWIVLYEGDLWLWSRLKDRLAACFVGEVYPKKTKKTICPKNDQHNVRV